MKPTYPSALRGTLAACSLACLVGCGSDRMGPRTVRAADVAAYPQGCAGWLDADDDTLAWAHVEGDVEALVLDTPDGSCVDEWAQVAALLESQDRMAVAERVAVDFASAETSTQSGPGAGLAAADPWPHPDQPHDTTSADPSPHPDRDGDEPDGRFPKLSVVGRGSPSAGGGAPPPPPPPAPAPGK